MKVKEALELPESMWDELDKAVATLSPHRPTDSFTFTEFRQRQGDISRAKAQKLLRKLRETGKVKLCGNGNTIYYQLVK